MNTWQWQWHVKLIVVCNISMLTLKSYVRKQGCTYCYLSSHFHLKVMFVTFACFIEKQHTLGSKISISFYCNNQIILYKG